MSSLTLSPKLGNGGLRKMFLRLNLKKNLPNLVKGNFPYPYMNGFLHIGHAFTVSKVEFAAAYHRLRGANVLFPFGFHCTGMPIKASADKLAREIERFGNPPVFPGTVEEQLEPELKNDVEQTEPDKFKGKKSKAASKSSGQMYQWEIMRSYGLSDAEIAEFKDPKKWLTFFPPVAVEDLKALGLGVDWRRSFITTDVNPHYDSFIQWQMRKLKSMGKIVKDIRYAIFSIRDGQPCADHDRASGEGVQPQEYTLIKMEVLPPFPNSMNALEGKNVFLAAATLRPETMYGQTNAWVLPDGKYGAFEINESDVLIVTERAALNLAYQNFSRIPQEPTCLVRLTGKDLIGLRVKSPLAFYDQIYVLPMLTILTDKGTGIVTSVPSDAPADYMALSDLKAKQALRDKYGVKEEWIKPIVPVINIPEFGDSSAVKVCTDLKIKSQNDKEKLEEAKRMTYMKGFNEGTMLVGEFAGRKVHEVKPLIKNKLIESGEAIVYSEPERKVISRSGDECIVALTDQWYITYDDEEWKALAYKCLKKMNLSDETQNGFLHSIGRLNHWACSRSFGLGTRIPWDEQFLVESLSDSTIYMAYYTIAHLLHGGDMYGDTTSSIKAEHMTDEIWEFIFCDGPSPKTDHISKDLLNLMKQEFNYWYPFDIRVSGKDLIQNHLTFSIYNHTALFPENLWPRAFRCNGHIMLNSAKMSKSTGNFRTIRQSIEEFSADATRFALADAGDGLDDANFVFETANKAILRLTKEKAWMEELLKAESSLRTGPISTFADRVFENELNYAIKKTEQLYEGYMFREALKSGFYDLQNARDNYIFACGSGGMNRDLILRFMDIQTRLLTPICPHYGEFVWREILRKQGPAVKAGWPTADVPNLALENANKYLQHSIGLMKMLLDKQLTSIEKCNIKGLVYVNEQYESWQVECLNILRSKFNDSTGKFDSDQEIKEALRNSETFGAQNFNEVLNQCMPFIKHTKKEFARIGDQALALKSPFGEVEVLQENVELIRRKLEILEVEVLSVADPGAAAKAGERSSLLERNPPSPGKPTAIFIPRLGSQSHDQ